jgi:hypothetical protein
MLTVLKDAARRLCRWQVAILDHSYAFARVGRWSGRRNGQIQSNKGMLRSYQPYLTRGLPAFRTFLKPRLGCSPLSRVAPSMSPAVGLQALEADSDPIKEDRSYHYRKAGMICRGCRFEDRGAARALPMLPPLAKPWARLQNQHGLERTALPQPYSDSTLRPTPQMWGLTTLWASTLWGGTPLGGECRQMLLTCLKGGNFLAGGPLKIHAKPNRPWVASRVEFFR